MLGLSYTAPQVQNVLPHPIAYLFEEGCVVGLYNLLIASQTSGLPAIREKYSSLGKYRVAQIPPVLPREAMPMRQGSF